MVEQQLKELTRNYQTAQDFYNDLLKKWQNAGVAGDLVSQQESEQFRVYDPPSLPDRPSYPKKVYFAGGGLGAGLALGVALLYLIGVSDTAMHTERDVELALKLPVLALVPLLEVLTQGKNKASKRQPSLGAIGTRN
jgi:capsular polysaccharide biosynthesis protein